MALHMTHLMFDTDIGRVKPVTLRGNQASCPFCQKEELTGIIAEDGPIILLYNKYPVLQDTVQTVLIETDDCNGELSLYNKEHLYKVIDFGLDHWLQMLDSGDFASVLFFKNHGPYSGGTLRHPHMQIVGLKNIDYTPRIDPACFTGQVIDRSEGVELNLAREPLIGFSEFNVVLQDPGQRHRLADYLQIMAHYLLNHFHNACNSYNIFFYRIEGVVSAKVVPRFVTSPIFVGYGIPQVSSHSEAVVRAIQSHYF